MYMLLYKHYHSLHICHHYNRYDNILHQELDPPERTTQQYEGPHMISRVAPAVAMPLDADEEEVTFTATAIDTAPPQPYLQV
jgi:hypothetical protein